VKIKGAKIFSEKKTKATTIKPTINLLNTIIKIKNKIVYIIIDF